jgi:hypothetical protein
MKEKILGRPIKKIFIGERGAGTAGGDTVASVTLGGTNNSVGYTGGDALTIGAPALVGGVQAVGEVTVDNDFGALLEGTTTFTPLSGLGVDGLGAAPSVFTGVTGTGSISGVGAVFTITKDNTNSITNYSDISSIVITSPGALYAVGETILIDGSLVGGVTSTNDLTLTVATSVGIGAITGTVITTAGVGYTSVPTVTADTGTQGTLTLTAVLLGVGNPVINCTAFLPGGSNKAGDIKAQKGNNTYRVITADGTGECALVAATPSAAGEMAIVATDSVGGTYWVTKLYNKTVRLVPNTGIQFSANDKVLWADVAVLDYSVKITS